MSDDQASKPEENIQSNDLEFSITEIQQELITLENNDLKLVVSNKGGEIVESVLKNYFDKEGNKIKINDSNQIFNLVSSNKSLRAFDSSKIIFESQTKTFVSRSPFIFYKFLQIKHFTVLCFDNPIIVMLSLPQHVKHSNQD